MFQGSVYFSVTKFISENMSRIITDLKLLPSLTIIKTLKGCLYYDTCIRRTCAPHMYGVHVR